MKKIILSLVFVFASLAISNANNENNTIFFKECWEEAWDYGTLVGEGDEYWEWYWTDQYIEWFCDENGNDFDDYD